MTETLIYWISTGLLSLLYLVSAFAYVTKGDWVRQALRDLGYPTYLVPFMVVIKLAGIAAILSRINVAVSDLAYAGILFHLILSAMAHLGVHKPKGAVPAAVGLLLLATSFATQNAARNTPSPHAHFAAIEPIASSSSTFLKGPRYETP